MKNSQGCVGSGGGQGGGQPGFGIGLTPPGPGSGGLGGSGLPGPGSPAGGLTMLGPVYGGLGRWEGFSGLSGFPGQSFFLPAPGVLWIDPTGETFFLSARSRAPPGRASNSMHIPMIANLERSMGHLPQHSKCLVLYAIYDPPAVISCNSVKPGRFEISPIGSRVSKMEGHPQTGVLDRLFGATI
jgi:hypothetical protein